MMPGSDGASLDRSRAIVDVPGHGVGLLVRERLPDQAVVDEFLELGVGNGRSLVLVGGRRRKRNRLHRDLLRSGLRLTAYDPRTAGRPFGSRTRALAAPLALLSRGAVDVYEVVLGDQSGGDALDEEA